MRFKEIILGLISGSALYLIWLSTDLLPIIIFVGLLGALLYFKGSQLGGKSFAVIGNTQDSKNVIVFEDIGGQEVAKNELREALEFIHNVEGIKNLGIRPLKGILLEGPPGTGKTLLAKAAAQFTHSVFLAASGSEFVEMYVGVGAQRVRKLFTQARSLAVKNNMASAVIFIDEIEVLGGKRGQNTGHLEYDQTLNELLVQMDGLSADDEIKVLVIGATNRADMLDTALLRPGRFDRQVRVDLPDKSGRLHILQLHTRNKPLSSDVCLDEIATATFGFSGAHLESLVNEAAITALREGEQTVLTKHLREAIDKVIMGEKLNRLPGKEEKKRIAIHEAGHALVSELLQAGSVASVNVSARGKALGYVRQTQEDDIYLYTAEYLKEKIAVALAGSVAEEIILGNRSTGASSDFQKAAEMARQIIYGGMSDLGIVSVDDLPAEMLHMTLTSLLHDIELFTCQIIESHVKELQAIVNVLLNNETISGTEFRQLLNGVIGRNCA